MKHIKTLIVAIAGLVLAAASSHAVLLTDLVNLDGSTKLGATLQQGDKIFANFTWVGPTGPAGFTITGIGDGTANNLYGIEFSGGLSQSGIGTSDWQLHYSVTIASGYNNLISDIHQHANFNGTPLSLVNVTEDVLNAPGGIEVAKSNLGEGINYAYLDTTDPAAELNDTLVLSTPLQQVWISKDIQLIGLGPNEYAVVSIIDQRFSQVPEPTTMIAGALLLLPFGASTLRILRKR
jgi:hypothetical protein